MYLPRLPRLQLLVFSALFGTVFSSHSSTAPTWFPGGNDIVLPTPIEDPAPLYPRPRPGSYLGSELEITNEQTQLFNKFNMFLTKVYGNQLLGRRLVGMDGDGGGEDATFHIAPGRSYKIDLTMPVPGTTHAFNASRPDLNPFYFGSMSDNRVHIEVWENDQAPVGLNIRLGVYRRLILRGHQKTLETLCQKCHDYFKPVIKNDKIAVYTCSHGWWGNPVSVSKRPLNTVYLDESIRAKAVNDLKHFCDQKTHELYRKYGIPYRRHYLLAGPPGTGKTSLIRALASEMDKSIGLLEFGKDFGQYEMARAMKNFPADFLIIEDIDSLFAGRDNDPSSNGLSFSDFINNIDGICSREGIVVFMTTNHPDRLDPALIRPGRVDMLIPMTHMTRSQMLEMFAAFFPDQVAHFDCFYDQIEHTDVSAAIMQGFFFRNLGCEDICDHISELVDDIYVRTHLEPEQKH